MSSREQLPKMMLGFVVRRCALAVGHAPNAEEFAAWANAYCEGDRTVHLFGRPISVSEAQVILRHQARPVAARSAGPYERIQNDDSDATPSGKVTSLMEAKRRLRAQASRKARPRRA